MKKILILVSLVLVNLPAFAGDTFIDIASDSSFSMAKFWEASGKLEEKTMTVGSRIINRNNIRHRLPFRVKRYTTLVNAWYSPYDNSITITKNLFRYFDNDDELAAVLAHEIGHSMSNRYLYMVNYTLVNTVSQGLSRILNRTFPVELPYSFISRGYETKADKRAVDLMVGAGYNPMYVITALNKICGEKLLLSDIFSSHPRGSKRLFKIYKYIQDNYPDKIEDFKLEKNSQYVNFTITAEDRIKNLKK